jgi:hypothetical protein
MMLGQITVHGFVAGQRQPDARGDQAVRFFGGILADHRKSHLSGFDVLQTFAARNQFAVRRKNRRDADDVARRNSRVAQSQLKTRESFTMLTDAFGEKYFLCDERHGPVFRASVCGVPRKISAEEK